MTAVQMGLTIAVCTAEMCIRDRSCSAYRILMRVESPNTRNRSANSYSTSSSGISKA